MGTSVWCFLDTNTTYADTSCFAQLSRDENVMEWRRISGVPLKIKAIINLVVQDEDGRGMERGFLCIYVLVVNACMVFWNIKFWNIKVECETSCEQITLRNATLGKLVTWCTALAFNGTIRVIRERMDACYSERGIRWRVLRPSVGFPT